MGYFIALAVVVLLVLGFLLIRRILVGESRLLVQRSEAHFPVVSGYNLDRQEFEFPRDFEGDLNLVIIPFLQKQQLDVNTWIPAAQELERTNNGFVYYELPTIYKLPALSRTFINEGMRAGIPDQTSRERTITLYLDKDAFKTALEITTEATITLILVDKEGNILWRDQGRFSEDKLSGLIEVVEQNIPK
jgi:hypothetical protein